MGAGESVIRNTDKRSSRREHRPVFQGAISRFRTQIAIDEEEDRLQGDSGNHEPPTRDRFIHVCVRKRPLFEHERKAGEFDVVSAVGARKGSPAYVVVHDARMHPDMVHLQMHHHSFTFDKVYGEKVNDNDVYLSAAAPLVSIAARGGYATIMMYGQTGSGKTYTMTGLHSRAAEDLFMLLAEYDAGRNGSPPAVFVSYVELAGDSCSDMLNSGCALKLITGADGITRPVPAVEVKCSTKDELLALIAHATALRATEATGVHSQSSRSHAICRCRIQGGPRGGGVLTLVDLAGSETRIDSDKHDAARRREGAQINSSLMALKECIRALTSEKAIAHRIHIHEIDNNGDHARDDNLNGGETGSHQPFIPFRRSSLTQLLRPSFTSEGAVTTVIATVSPASKDTEHSLNTLRHAAMMDGRKPKHEEKAKSKGSHTRGGILTIESLGAVDVRAHRNNRGPPPVPPSPAEFSERAKASEPAPTAHAVAALRRKQLKKAERLAMKKLTPEAILALKEGRNVVASGGAFGPHIDEKPQENCWDQPPSKLQPESTPRRRKRDIQSPHKGNNHIQNEQESSSGFEHDAHEKQPNARRKSVPTIKPWQREEENQQNGNVGVSTTKPKPVDRVGAPVVTQKVMRLAKSLLHDETIPLSLRIRQLTVVLKQNGLAGPDAQTLAESLASKMSQPAVTTPRTYKYDAKKRIPQHEVSYESQPSTPTVHNQRPGSPIVSPNRRGLHVSKAHVSPQNSCENNMSPRDLERSRSDVGANTRRQDSDVGAHLRRQDSIEDRNLDNKKHVTRFRPYTPRQEKDVKSNKIVAEKHESEFNEENSARDVRSTEGMSRHEKAKQARKAVEEAARQRALEKLKRAESNGPAWASDSGDSNASYGVDVNTVRRLEAQLSAHDISPAAAHGLRRQLATQKAVLLRAQRRQSEGNYSNKNNDTSTTYNVSNTQSRPPPPAFTGWDGAGGEEPEHVTSVSRAKWHIMEAKRIEEAAAAELASKAAAIALAKAQKAQEELNKNSAWNHLQDDWQIHPNNQHTHNNDMNSSGSTYADSVHRQRRLVGASAAPFATDFSWSRVDGLQENGQEKPP